MAKIETLVQDVSDLLQNKAGVKNSVELKTEVLGGLGVAVAGAMNKSLNRDDGRMRSDPNVIYASEFGNKCVRQLWYKMNFPHQAAPIGASARFKFFYGDIVEESFLALVQLAGHKVEHRQKEVEISYPGSSRFRIRGRIDAVIDDVLVDVKSVTTRGFEEFKSGHGGKKFGYADQLALYNMGVGAKEKGFVYVDRQLGHFGYSKETASLTKEKVISKLVLIEEHLEEMHKHEGFGRLAPEPEGASGNMKLCTECSYCAYKKDCWQDANGGKGLRAFSYSNKVVFLTKVAKEPKVMEIK